MKTEYQIQVKVGTNEWQPYGVTPRNEGHAKQMLAHYEAAEMEFAPSDREEFRITEIKSLKLSGNLAWENRNESEPTVGLNA